MTSHPVTEPMLAQFLNAESDAARAALLLATPPIVLVEFQGQYRRALEAVEMTAGTAYLDALLAILSARRDQWGRPERFLEVQIDAARMMLCIGAGSVAFSKAGSAPAG